MAQCIRKMARRLHKGMILFDFAMIFAGLYTTAIAEHVYQCLNERFCLNFDQRNRCVKCIIYLENLTLLFGHCFLQTRAFCQNDVVCT